MDHVVPWRGHCPEVLMKTVITVTLGIFNHMVINTNPMHGLSRHCPGSLAPYKDCPVTGTFTKVICRHTVDFWVFFTNTVRRAPLYSCRGKAE